MTSGRCGGSVFRTRRTLSFFYLQMDDPPINHTAVRWGACFCDHCLAGFRAFLEQKTTPKQRLDAGVQDVATFDYRAYLKEKGAPSGDAFAKWQGGALKSLFADRYYRIGGLALPGPCPGGGAFARGG